MDVIEALNKLSVIVNTEELKQSVPIACELRESIAANQIIATAESSGKLSELVKSEQVLLAQKLRNALNTLQVLAIEHVSELGYEIGDRMLQRVAEVIIQLDKDLNTVIATVNETVQEKIMKEQVTQGIKEEGAPVMALPDQEIVREELLPITAKRGTAVEEQITAIDSTYAIEEATHSEDKMSKDKQENLIDVETIDNAIVANGTPMQGIILKPANEKIVDDSKINTTGKSTGVNGNCAYYYCFIFLKNQDIEHLTQNIKFSIVSLTKSQLVC